MARKTKAEDPQQEGQKQHGLGVEENVEVVMLPIDRLSVNPWNVNELSDTMFNRLTEDMESIGFLQPILVVPLEGEEGQYRIVDGEHRYECARLLDRESIPCVVVTGDLAEDEIKQRFMTMRMNLIKGQIDKRKFKSLVEDLMSRGMELEVVAEGMAYDDIDALRALIDDTRATLPPEMRKEFDKAKEEIKTVDDLTKVLNRLFTKYGETLPCHYMILDFGGKESIWVRMRDKREYERFKAAADLCREHGKTFRSALLHALSHIDAEYLTTRADELEDAEYEKAENAQDAEGVDGEDTDLLGPVENQSRSGQGGDGISADA